MANSENQWPWLFTENYVDNPQSPWSRNRHRSWMFVHRWSMTLPAAVPVLHPRHASLILGESLGKICLFLPHWDGSPNTLPLGYDNHPNKIDRHQFTDSCSFVYLPPAKRSCGKVMFLHLCHSVQRVGVSWCHFLLWTAPPSPKDCTSPPLR